MEQRRYRSTLTPEALGDLLVQHFNQERRAEAQRLGAGDSALVQVRHGREDHQREALTIGITRQVSDGTVDDAAPGITHAADAPAPAPTPATASNPDLVVTVGEQQWFNANQVGWPPDWGALHAVGALRVALAALAGHSGSLPPKRSLDHD